MTSPSKIRVVIEDPENDSAETVIPAGMVRETSDVVFSNAFSPMLVTFPSETDCSDVMPLKALALMFVTPET